MERPESALTVRALTVTAVTAESVATVAPSVVTAPMGRTTLLSTELVVLVEPVAISGPAVPAALEV